MFLLPLSTAAQIQLSANFNDGCTPLGVVVSVTAPANPSSVNWQITRPDGSIQNASNTQYIAILSIPGTYDFRVTVNGTQTQNFEDFITVWAKPTANFTTNVTTGCWPLCVDFTDTSTPGDGAIVSYNWDFGNGTTSTAATPQNCYPNAGTFSPVFSIADEHGCISDITFPGLIQVTNNFPNTQFTMSESVTCNAPVNVAFNNSSTGNGALSTLWNFGDNTPETTNNNSTFNRVFTQPGQYSVCAIVSDNFGCSKQLCQPLNILSDVAAEFTASSSLICANNTVSFSCTNQPIPTAFEWDLDGDNQTDATTANPSFNFLQPGTFTPTLTIHYGNNCSASATADVPITVLPEIAPQFFADTTSACSLPFSVHFANTTVSTGVVNYAWYISDTFVSNAQHLDYSFQEFGDYTVKLVVTNAAGCSEEIEYPSYIQIQSPALTFGTPNTICTGEQVEISSFTFTSVDPIETYDWDFDGDGVTDDTNAIPVFHYTSAGAYAITLNVTTVHGCTATGMRAGEIIVQTQTNTDFTANTTTSCAGMSIQFCVTEQPGNTYAWDFGDQTGWQMMDDEEYCKTHDYQDTGYFSVTLTVFNGACSATTTYEDYIYITPPVAKFDYSLDCSNLLTVQFGDQSIEAETLTWDFGDGSPVSHEINPSHTYATQGSYTVTLTAVNDALGCPDVTSNTVTLSPPSADLTFSATEGCPPLQVQLGSATENATWNIEVSTGDQYFIWFDDLRAHWIVQHTSPTVSDSLVYNEDDNFWPNLSFDQNGCYDFNVSVTDANGCSTSHFYDDAVCVSASANFAGFTVETINVCDSVSFAFHPIAQNLVNPVWTFSDGATTSAYNASHTFSPPFNYSAPLEVTLSAGDPQGCTSSVTQTIDVHLPVVPRFVVTNNPSCIGEPVNFLNFSSGPAVGYTWTFDDDGSGANNTANTFNATHTFVGDQTLFNVCLSADNGHGCVSTFCDPNAVFIATPQVNFTYTSTITNCLFGVQFTNTTPGIETNITWDFGDNQTGTGQTTYHTYPIGVYDVTLTVTNNHGCTDSLFIPDILNYGNVIGPFSQQLDPNPCAPFDAAFQAYNANDTFFTYFWDFDDGTGDPSGNTTTSHTYTQPGTYCPSIIMTDANGCNALVPCEQPIVVEEFTLQYNTPDYICFGDTLSFEVSNGTSYSWQASPYIASGTYIGEYLLFPTTSSDFVLTGYLGDCSTTDSIHLEVRSLPVVTLDIDPEVCHQDEIFGLYGGAPAGGSYFVNGASSLLFNPSWSPNEAYNIRYEFTDAFGCINSASSNIFIHALPNVTLSPIPPSCENDDAFSFAGGLPQGGVYQLNSGVVTSINPSILGPGTYDVQYTFTDNNGCTATGEQPYTIHPTPQIDVHFDALCSDDAFTVSNYTSIAAGIITAYAWDFGVAGSSVEAEPTNIRFPEIGVYPITLEATSNHGCTNEFDSTLRVNATPIARFDGENGCQQSELLFIDQSTIEEGTIAATYWTAEGFTQASPDSFLYAFAGWGNQSVTLVVVSENGCNDTLQKPFTIYPLPIANIDAPNVCLGEASVYSSNASIPSGGIAEYTWTLESIDATQNAANASVYFGEAGVYTAHLSLVSNLGCTREYTDSTRVYPLPLADFMLQEESICENTSLVGEDLSTVPAPHTIVSWQWYVGDVLVGQQPQLVNNTIAPGLWDVRLVVTSESGCAKDTTMIEALQVNPAPIAGFELVASEIRMDVPLAQVVNTASDDVVAWTYDFGDDSPFEHFASGDHTYEQWGTFTIRQVVENIFGCRAQVEEEIGVIQAVQTHIPNAFTPDENGHNETFQPVISGDELTYYKLQIFDRWGNKVFETNDLSDSWNGRYFNSGAILSDGAYVWRLEVRGSLDAVIEVREGSVILLK